MTQTNEFNPQNTRTHTRPSTGNASLLFLLARKTAATIRTTTIRTTTTLASEIEKQPKTNIKFKWEKLCAKNVSKKESEAKINKLKVALKI